MITLVRNRRVETGRITWLREPCYYPHLAPGDFNLSPNTNEIPKWNVVTETVAYFKGFKQDVFFGRVEKKSRYRWTKRIQLGGGYI